MREARIGGTGRGVSGTRRGIEKRGKEVYR